MAEPTPVMRSWEVNEGQAVPAGPWETPGPGPDAATLAGVASVVSQLPPEEQARLAARVEQLAEQAEPQEAAPAFDPDQMFGSPDPEGAGESGYAAPTKGAGSTGSSPLAGVNPLQERLRAKAFGQLAEAAFAAVSALLNVRLRLDEEDETWLADGDDLKGVGAPAGRIIARHAPLPDGTNAGDLSDGIGIAIAATAYLIKNTRARAGALRMRRRAQAPAEA